MCPRKGRTGNMKPTPSSPKHCNSPLSGGPKAAGSAVFRREFDISSDITKADFHLFADSRYALYVNGQFVLTGPSRFDPISPEYDTIDLKGYLKQGKNVIAVKESERLISSAKTNSAF